MKMTINKKWSYLIIIASILLFIMFLFAPVRLDDWAWGGKIGIDRLQSKFAGYNGRYVGNMIVIVLLRLPNVIRALVQTAFVLLFFKMVYEILEQNVLAFSAFIIAFACVPLKMSSQCITWVSGYANYFMAAVCLVYIIKTVFNIVFNDAELKKYNYVIFPCIVFLSQLILETATIYIFVFLITMTCISFKKKNKKNIIFLIVCTLLSVAGLMLMYSNSAYRMATEDQSYKKINFFDGFLSQIGDWFDKFIKEMMPDFVSNYNILIMLILVGLVVLWAAKGGKLSKIMCCIGSAFAAFFMYDMLDTHWENLYRQDQLGLIIRFSVSLLMYIYLIISISVLIKGVQKVKMLIISLSQIILVAPLIVASPLGVRCFFHNYIFWALILGQIVSCIYEKIKHKLPESFESHSIRVAAMFVVMLIVCNIGVQIKTFEIYKIREKIMEDGKANHVEKMILPQVPYVQEYCFGAQVSNKNEYWIANYKAYYGIPADTEVKFMDYYKWLKKYK
ncbi:MAG: hypothetical protein K2G45_08625 [Lachnospiraceae bacterium]|nr:hypothetical protein [Lachnospiraceae bacterium]